MKNKALFSVCWGFDFGASAAKFCSGQGAMRKHSHSCATEEQRSTGQNLASAAQKVNPQQTLSMNSYFK